MKVVVFIILVPREFSAIKELIKELERPVKLPGLSGGGWGAIIVLRYF